MSHQNTALVVEGQAPAMPCVVLEANTVEAVANLAQAATDVVVKDAESAAEAARMLSNITRLARDIENAREEAKRPFFQFGKRIDAVAKVPATTLANALNAVRAKITAYQVEIDRKAREEAERVRKEQERLAAEAARLAREAARVAEEKARAAEAARLAALPPTDDDDMADLVADIEADDIAEQQAAVAAQVVQIATKPVPAVPAPQGIYFRTTLRHTVKDVDKLPRNLVTITANDAEIRRLFCVGWKEGDPVPAIAGLEFTVDKTPIAGRR